MDTSMLKKLLFSIMSLLTLCAPLYVSAQVFGQNQLLLSPFGNNGFVVSTTTANGAKLSATSTPFFNKFSFGSATGTTLFTTTASTTNFFGANLITCNSGNVLTWAAGKFGCAADATGSSGGDPFFHLTPTQSSTSTGLQIFASTTIGGGTKASGLTIAGGSTTTLNAYFATGISVGTSSPEAPVTFAQTGGLTSPEFVIDGVGAGAGAEMELNRTNNSGVEANIDFNTAGAERWQLGMQNNNTDDFELWQGTTDNPVFTINQSSLDVNIGTTTCGNTIELCVWGDASGGDSIFAAMTSASTSAFIVNNNGNVGINGTSSPYAKLAIASISTGDETPTIVVDGAATANGNADIAFNRANSGTAESNIDFNTAGVTNWQLGTQNVATNGNDFILSTGASASVLTVKANTNVVGVGTSTPFWELTVATGTAPQLALTDGVAANSPWTFRAISGSFFLASSTAFATSTTAALAINSTTGALTISGGGTTTLSNGIQTTDINETGGATSTFTNGINVSSGCFSVNGTCIGATGPAGSGGSGDPFTHPLSNVSATTSKLEAGAFFVGTTTGPDLTDLVGSFPNFKVYNTTGSQFAGAGFMLINQLNSMGNQAGTSFYAGINDAGISNGYFSIDRTNSTGGGQGHVFLADYNANTETFYPNASTQELQLTASDAILGTNMHLSQNGSGYFQIQDGSGAVSLIDNEAPSANPQEATLSNVRTLSAGNREFTDYTQENYGEADDLSTLNIGKQGTGVLRPFGIRFWNQDLGTVSNTGQFQMLMDPSGATAIGDYATTTGVSTKKYDKTIPLQISSSTAPTLLQINAGVGTPRLSVLNAGNLVLSTAATSTFAGGVYASLIAAPYIIATSTATSTFAGGLNVLAINETGTATSTYNNGINVSSGCFSIAGVCVTGGSASTPQFDIFTHPLTTTSATTSLMLLSGNASTTMLSVFTTGFFGGTSTSTINGNGATSTLKSSLVISTTSPTALNIQDQYGTSILFASTASTTAGYDLLELWSATSTGPLFGVDQYGHVFASSTTPVLSSCGTTPSLSSDSNDFSGTITVGSVAATACTLSFGTPHTTGTHCVISEQTGSVVNVSTYTEGLTGFTYSQTGLTSDKLDYICTGK